MPAARATEAKERMATVLIAMVVDNKTEKIENTNRGLMVSLLSLRKIGKYYGVIFMCVYACTYVQKGRPSTMGTPAEGGLGLAPATLGYSK